MNDKDLFTQALGIQPPWQIKDVHMDLEAQRVEIEVECAQTVWADPQTQQRVHIHGYEERRWRHLDTMQFETFILAKVPRLKYPDGRTEMLPIPWAETHSRHTLFLKHGPANRSQTPAGCSGSPGMPLTGSWSAPCNADSSAGK